MAVTTENRKAYRHAWRKLVDDAIAAGVDPAASARDLASYASGARNWVLPTEDRGDGYLLAALGHMAVAYGQAASLTRRVHLAHNLIAWAHQCQVVLDRLTGATTVREPQFRLRADIDGPFDDE